MAKVTIVTLCYNQGQYLQECIDSVQQQTFTDWEHIVVDPASQDNTSEVVYRARETSKKVYLFKLAKDCGLSTSRNVGFMEGEGEYFVSLDADDKIHPQFLEKLVAQMEPKTIVCPGLQEFNGGTNQGWPTWGVTYEDFLGANRIFCCSMTNEQDFWSVGGYSEELDELGFEDYDLWIKLTKNGCKVKIVPELLFYYRGDAMHGHPGSSTTRTKERHDERTAYFRRVHGVGW